MSTWQLQEAKSRFSELVEQALSNGPQWVTRRGEEAVVVLAAADYRLLQQGPSLVKVLTNAPRGEPLVLQRSVEPVRDLYL
ncbi:type II toxin-antitoxin system Phd/YefM family antitoxin [Rhodoferax sp. U2-2l]|uniref:type II toxin-antitoxin system Phd/YefM family antitoxin n=1 Tax=Rhodoferax sp. U2-2l TaxID=2884000 RepID=UPI001D0B21C4|nr:type II toxin-antitoxin system Phd/YefM family antitoxin [Rhodoferax sp. U2-2l]MCB8747869.1 type II toxin-antitoxin system Phd/YefM family antitoxin [Rhodoferax sp. U2-2l]